MHLEMCKLREPIERDLKMKQKLARTLNFAVWGRLTNEEREGYFEYFPKHLFSYNKGWEEGFKDPNSVIYGNLEGRTLRRDFREELGL